MKRLGPSLALLTLIVASASPLVAEGEAAGKAYGVLEVARFEVNREDYSTKEAERAGRIPEEMLDTIQRILISEFSQSKILPTVRKAGAEGGADEAVVELGGQVVDFLAGSQAKRLLVGLGAGQQKIEVNCVLRDRASGAILGQERIVDRKVGGWAGGSEDKGVRDFAERVAKFIRATLRAHGKKAP